MVVNRKTFAPKSAVMCKVYQGHSAHFQEFLESFASCGWTFRGAVSVAEDSTDWLFSVTSTYVYFD